MKKIKGVVALLLAFCLTVSMWGICPQTVAADEAAQMAVVVDGNAEDWYYIEPLFMGGGVISKLSAFTYEGMLYMKMEVANTSAYDTWHIYFETDGDKTNHLYATGTDYMLETDWLYEYQGEGNDWDGLVSIQAAVTTGWSKDKKVLEASIPLEAMGNPSEIGINGAVVANWVDVASQPTAGEYLTVPAFDAVVRETMAGLTQVEQEELEASKQFAGTQKQWEAIDYDAVFKNSNLKALKAVSDGEYLYVQVSAKKLSNNFTLFIKTEEPGEGTDKSEIWTDGSDMGYQLKANGVLYKMKANKRMDLGTQMTEFYKSDQGFEVKIPLSALNTEGTTFWVGIDDKGETLPDAGRELLEITSPIMEAAPVITIDGNPDDWKGVEPIGNGEDTLGDLYAIRTNDALYVMTYISGVTDPESSAAYTTSLFIDSDNNTETGYQHPGYPAHSGGNFLVQDWYSYGPSRNLEFFFTDSPVILPWNMKKQYVEGYEKVFAKTDKAGVYCAEWMVPISNMQEVTPAVSDDLYICVDRDDCQTDEATYERKTPYGYTPVTNAQNGEFAKVPKYQTTFALDFTDFGFEDWNSVCNVAKHQNLLNLCAVRTDEKLFTMLTSKDGLTTDNTYYISTNNEGFDYDGYENINYVIEDGKLYKVTAADQKAKEYKSVYQYYSADVVLMQLYLEWLDNPGAIDIAVVANKGGIILPETGMLTTAKEVSVEREADLFYPVENFDVYNNPYKGWVGWADVGEGDIDNIAVLYDLIYVDIKWSEIEKVKGVYDFEAIEKQYQFDKWLDKGCRMVLRFVMDNPGIVNGNPDIKRMDIPQWLYDELEAENAEGAGAGVYYLGQTIYDLLGGVGFSPNYKSPKLLEYHRNVVKALAERYDDPSITAYVEVGSLGHWAEFHCWPTGTGEFPEPQLAQEYMRPYADYFHNVRVGIRKPYALAAENGWGLYNDIFGVTSDGGTPTFLEWANSGNTDMPGSTPEDIAASKMPEWWKNNFSGGEFASGDFRTNAKTENICAVLGQIRDSHTTWLGPCSACDIKYSTGDYDFYAYNIEVMLKTMGYRYNLQSITKVAEATPGSAVALKMVWNNSGVAPIYYNCPVKLVLVDANGNVAYEQQLAADVTTWQQGRTSVEDVLNLPADLALGQYSLQVQMNAADEKAEIIELAMEGKTEAGRYELYTMTITDKLSQAADGEQSDATVEEESATGDEQQDVTTDAQAAAKQPNVVVIVVVVAVVVVAVAAVAVVSLKKKKNKK